MTMLDPNYYGGTVGASYRRRSEDYGQAMRLLRFAARRGDQQSALAALNVGERAAANGFTPGGIHSASEERAAALGYVNNYGNAGRILAGGINDRLRTAAQPHAAPGPQAPNPQLNAVQQQSLRMAQYADLNSRRNGGTDAPGGTPRGGINPLTGKPFLAQAATPASNIPTFEDLTQGVPTSGPDGQVHDVGDGSTVNGAPVKKTIGEPTPFETLAGKVWDNTAGRVLNPILHPKTIYNDPSDPHYTGPPVETPPAAAQAPLAITPPSATPQNPAPPIASTDNGGWDEGEVAPAVAAPADNGGWDEGDVAPDAPGAPAAPAAPSPGAAILNRGVNKLTGLPIPAPDGSRVMSNADAKSAGAATGRPINRLTGLPMGYSPGDALPAGADPDMTARAAASAGRQIAAATSAAVASPQQQADAQRSMVNSNAIPAGPAAAQPLMPRGPASQPDKIAPDFTQGTGPYSNAAYAKTDAALQQGVTDKAAHDDHMDRLTRLGAIHPNYLWGLHPDGTPVTPESAKAAEGKLQYPGTRPQGAVPFGYTTPDQ